MVKKSKSIYVCQSCAHESPQWTGQCSSCGSWNTLVETISVPSTANKRGISIGNASQATQLSTVKAEKTARISSNIGEFDRVLGGGFVPGQVILLAGDPGIGKSTILTQLAEKMGSEKVLYVCGEESLGQVKIRADRMGYKAENLLVLAETDVDVIAATIENIKGLALIIVDSIQTLFTNDLTGATGSVGQVRESSKRLADTAKRLSVPLILVGHVTKQGTVAGPKVLEHMVDTVLYLEGDSQHMYRLLKTTKNRFGPVSEIGVFEMAQKGMREIKNPSEMFLSERLQEVSGSCVTVVLEGMRPILFEIQALVTKTAFGYPRRTTSGFNVNRLNVLIAILEKRCKTNFSNYDVFLNVAGGYKVSEYATDLAVCLALVSSLKDQPVGSKVVAFGECGLSGELRKVPQAKKRENEAKKLGYSVILSPDNAKSLQQVVQQIFK